MALHMTEEQYAEFLQRTGRQEKRMASAKPPVAVMPTEAEEQATLFQWAAMMAGALPEVAMLYHIPNEGRRSRAAGGQLKAEGLKRGVPDLCLPVARKGCHGLYIELKRRRGGRLSAEQSDWLDRLARQGYMVAVCEGWEAARDVILNYLNCDNT